MGEPAARPANALPYLFDIFSVDQLKDALRRMVMIRLFEESAENSYMRGLIHGTMHLSIGQEASAVGVCMVLESQDQITSTHRGHGHCIAKGADVKRMFAEFFGKEEGYCRGRGGSMHIADIAGGNLGANGIVGGGIPIAVGAALANQRLQKRAVVVAFFGDGANNEGVFHESLNMASIWKLPVVFVCENNGYGMSTSTEKSTAIAAIADRAAAYSMPGVCVDGNDLGQVAAASARATSRARQGDGPSLIECKTYRWRGHSRSDRNRYRTTEEIDAWKLKDPILQFRRELIKHAGCSEAELDAITEQSRHEIEEALAFAKAGTDPDPAELTENVYTPQESH